MLTSTDRIHNYSLSVKFKTRTNAGFIYLRSRVLYSQNMNQKIVYADGSSLGNPGRGGWAFVVIDESRRLLWEFGGGETKATNNQMELRALLEALTQLTQAKSLGAGMRVEFRLDSQYVIKGVTEWSKGWIKNGWKTSAKKDVLNKEYWVAILELKKILEERGVRIQFTHVFGHTGEVWNERVDEIARGLAEGKEIVLKQGKSIVI